MAVSRLHYKVSVKFLRLEKAFPFGEGGFFNAHAWALKKTEEVLPQYEFAEDHQQNQTGYRASPAPFGGTLPKGEGLYNKKGAVSRALCSV